MDFFRVISLDEAIDRIIKRLDYINKPAVVPLQQSLEKTLFEDVFAGEDLPSFAKSVVDGYAVRAADTCGAGENLPTILKLVASVTMGKAPQGKVAEGLAYYVPTGGMLPQGADSVAMSEHTQLFDKDELAVYKSLHLRENVLDKGDDFVKGALLAPAGKRICPMTIGLFASMGIDRIKVLGGVSFYIISTGDELADITDELAPGRVRDINSYSLAAMVRASGYNVVGSEMVKDDELALKEAVARGIQTADIILVSGGSSVGKKDYTHAVIQSLGNDVFIKGIALKPGKPTICGSADGKLIFGLPGHPMAAAIVYKALVQKAIAKSRKEVCLPRYFATAETNFPSAPGRTTFYPVKCSLDNCGISARPLFGKSGTISPLAEADGYIMIPPTAEGIYKGQNIAVYGFKD